MRRLLWGVGGLVIAMGLAMSSVGTAQAAPIGPAAAASQNAGSLATPVHCRRVPPLPSPLLVASRSSPLPPLLPSLLISRAIGHLGKRTPAIFGVRKPALAVPCIRPTKTTVPGIWNRRSQHQHRPV